PPVSSSHQLVPSITPPQPRTTLFPYTTLFRSQQNQRERTENGEEYVTLTARQGSRRGAPRDPCRAVEQPREADAPAHPPRQDDCLERIPQHGDEQHGAQHTAQQAQGYLHDSVGTLAGGSSD